MIEIIIVFLNVFSIHFHKFFYLQRLLYHSCMMIQGLFICMYCFVFTVNKVINIFISFNGSSFVYKIAMRHDKLADLVISSQLSKKKQYLTKKILNNNIITCIFLQFSTVITQLLISAVVLSFPTKTTECHAQEFFFLT